MRLSHQVSLRFVGRLSTQLVGLARAMALARLMRQEQFGLYGQGMLIATLLSPYVAMGLQSAVPYFLTRLPARRQSGLVWATGADLSVAGLVAALALALLGDTLTARWGGAALERNCVLAPRNPSRLRGLKRGAAALLQISA